MEKKKAKKEIRIISIQMRQNDKIACNFSSRLVLLECKSSDDNTTLRNSCGGQRGRRIEVPGLKRDTALLSIYYMRSVSVSVCVSVCVCLPVCLSVYLAIYQSISVYRYARIR